MSVPTSTQPSSSSSSAKLKPSSPSSAIFQEALREFKKNLTVKELAYFESVNFEEVEDTIEKIQFDQKGKKQMRDVARIRPFLDVMIQYGKIVEVFLNTSNVLAFVWGPMKTLLMISSTFLDAFDYLLSAYVEIGECLPLYSQYEEYFKHNPYMQKMLGYVYKDLLTFHSRVYKIMSKPMWKNLFTVTSSSFKAALVEIRTNLLRHKDLVERQAGLLHFDQYRNDRELAEQRFQENERLEIQRQKVEVFEWLSMTSSDSIPATVDQEQYASKRKDYPTSGQWLQTCRTYQEWIDPQANLHLPVIWLYGIPGAGKTILASCVIEQVCQVSDFTVAWFYCKFGNTDKSTLLGVIKGIMAHFVNTNDQLRPHILEARNKSGVLKLTSPQAGKDLMSECLRVLDKTCIIIDGLDECDPQERKEIILLYTRLAKELNDDQPGSLRILFVSTDEPDIRKLLSKVVHIALKEAHNCLEMRDYATKWAKKIQELFGLPEQEMKGIVEEVMKRAQGMYLYCYLVLNNLHSQFTREGLKRELQPDCLPNGLGDAYDKILHRIDSHPQPLYRTYVSRILGWLACSRRPLKWHEIQGALSVSTDGTFNLEERRLRVGAKELCGALVEVQFDGTVEFVHTSAREHRHQTNQLPPKEPWIDIAEARFQAALVCVQYLTMDCFRVDLSNDKIYDFMQKGYYCLQDYAVVHWYDHVELCLQGAPDVGLLLHPLLCALSAFLTRNWDASVGIGRAKNNKRVAQRLKMLKDARFPEVFPQLARFASAREDLYFGSSPLPFLNFEIPVRRARACLEAQQDPNGTQVQEYYGHDFNYFKCRRENCLRFSQGFLSMSERDKHELLHNRGFRCPETTCPSADLGFATQAGLQSHMSSQHPENILLYKEDDSFTINLADSNDILLVEAAEEGKLNMVKILVQRGIDVNTPDQNGRTALHLAAASGHESIARMLLENGASVEVKDSTGWTPLYHAANNGHEGIARMLLENEASVEVKANQEWTPLHYAAYNGHESIVRLLLENGASVDAKDNVGRTPLHGAARNGHEGIARMLLENEASVEVKGYAERTSLHNAAREGHEGIARMLLENGASVDAKDSAGWTPLHHVADNGHEGIVRMLLENEASVEVKANEEWTPLHYAAYNGHESIVRLLLENGASVDAKDNVGRTPLHGAARNGHEDIARMLLENEASVEVKGYAERTSLHNAAREGHEGIARMLLENGASVDAKDSAGWTPLHHVADNGHEGIVRMLLENEASVEVKANEEWTPLHHAASKGHESVARMLLENRASVDAKDSAEWTPLHHAADNGHESIARMLLENGASVEAKTNNERMPLHHAASKGHESVARMLLENGASVDAKDNVGRTPLHHAARNDHESMARILLENGASVDARDCVEGTPLHEAAGKCHDGIVRLLLENGASVEVNDDLGRTPLHEAACHDHEGIVRLLLENGASVEVEDNSGRTPLYHAQRNNHKIIQQILESSR